MVNNNEDFRILAIKDKKVAITTISAKPAIQRLLTMSVKVVLVEDRQNLNIKKI